MSMMGEMNFFLRLQVNQFSDGIFINQSKYILDILKRFGLENCDTVPTPMVEQATLKLDLVGKPVDHTDYRSMIKSLIVQFLGDKLVCWSSKKQNYVSISTAESEYVIVSGCCAQVLWMRTQLTDYGFFYDKVPIYCDSKSAIAISCNLVQHTRTKHIDVRTGIDLPQSLPSLLGKLSLVGESSPNPTSSYPKRRNRRRSKQPFILEESFVDTMADQRTMAELLRVPTEGCAEAIVVPLILAEHFELKHSLINMMTSDQFFGLEKDNHHDHIRCDANSSSSSEIAKLTHVVNQQTSVVTTAMTAILKQFQATPPLASVKAVEEICVTCGGAYLYYQCLAADGNTFSEFQDNIQGYVSAAAVNYNQGNSGYRPLGVANQIRPSGFAQPNVQNIQN
uniref:Reverse transcriptase Ty1/copia-type domain-containing protein n=1 Tax=Tanacetum cinerariifolium TaxID=118510 RepID=A0A699I9E3_TANCI|nr:hypothetical protein [Tanacetum cinerariifolium]